MRSATSPSGCAEPPSNKPVSYFFQVSAFKKRKRNCILFFATINISGTCTNETQSTQTGLLLFVLYTRGVNSQVSLTGVSRPYHPSVIKTGIRLPTWMQKSL